MDYAGIGAAIVFATFWYKGAEMENISPVYWAGPSVLLSGLVMFALKMGWGGIVLAQLAMFAAIAVYRVSKDMKSSEGKE
jgi:integral membrane sensor domain MASE1